MSTEADDDPDFTGFHGNVKNLLRNFPGNVDVNNASKDSSKVSPIIVIRPLSKDLMHNPIEIAKSIKASTFGKYPFKDIVTNKKKQVITVELEKPSDKIVHELLQVTKLGKWDVTCSGPNAGTDMMKTGVISPVSKNIDLDDLLQFIKIKSSNINQNQQTKIKSIHRLNRKVNNEWEPSLSIKILFEGEALPDAVTILHSYYRVRPYVGEPLQCYNCQRLGHTAKNCKGKERCLLCSGNHNKKDCDRATNQLCANCKGGHRANSNECPHYKTATEIEKVRANRNMSYHEAKTEVSKRNANKNNLVPTLTQSYAQITNPNSQIQQASATIGQENNTDLPILENQCKCNHSQHLQDDFLEKLKICLLDILSNLNTVCDNTSKESLIDNAIKNNFSNKRKIVTSPENSEDSFLSDIEEQDVLLADSQPTGCIAKNFIKLPDKNKSQKGRSKKKKH